MLDQYVNKNERNQVDQDNKQDKETNYLSNDQNTNNIVDKDELDQDHNGIQANIVDNKDDPYNENICILQYAKESKLDKSNIIDSSSTLTTLP